MKNISKYLAIVFGSLAAIFIIGGLVIPKEWSVRESININADKRLLYREIADFKNWSHWSPWQDEVAKSQNTYEGDTLGLGQKLSWVGDNMKGYMKITKADVHNGISYELFMDMNNSQYTLFGDINYVSTEHDLEVTWQDFGDSGNNLPKRWMSLFIKPQLAKQFKEGLASLKTRVESMKFEEHEEVLPNNEEKVEEKLNDDTAKELLE